MRGSPSDGSEVLAVGMKLWNLGLRRKITHIGHMGISNNRDPPVPRVHPQDTITLIMNTQKDPRTIIATQIHARCRNSPLSIYLQSHGP